MRREWRGESECGRKEMSLSHIVTLKVAQGEVK
jgi:hypothetical protein